MSVAAGEIAGKFLVVVGKHVDAEAPVGEEQAACAERPFMHTSSVGGSSETLHMAVAVKPPRPAGPSVVTMLTGAQTLAMASRKSVFEICVAPSAFTSAGEASGGSQVSPVQPFSS